MESFTAQSKNHSKNSKNFMLLHGIDCFTQEDLETLRKDRESGNPEAILAICVSTTSACNIRCWYCYAIGNKKTNPQQLTLSEYRTLLDQAVDLGARTMVVCGDGEPTYDPKLVSIVEYAAQLGLTPVVVTNGTMFGNDNASRVKHGMNGNQLAHFLFDHHASLLVKLETIDPRLYVDTVKVKNAWQWFTRGIDRLAAIGFGDTWEEPAGRFTRLSFTGIATKDNIGEIPKLADWARSHNAQYVCKVPSPTGGALDCVQKLFPPDQLDEIRAYIAQYADKHETLNPIILGNDSCKACLAWHLGPVISETGYYVECYTSTGAGFGSIREQTLKQLLTARQKGTAFNSPCPIKDRLYVQLVSKEEMQAMRAVAAN